MHGFHTHILCYFAEFLLLSVAQNCLIFGRRFLQGLRYVSVLVILVHHFHVSDSHASDELSFTHHFFLF